MNTTQLQNWLTAHGLKIDDWHGGAGQFRDLYVGMHENWGRLIDLLEELKGSLYPCELDRVDNRNHPDYGTYFIKIPSFWWED